MNSVVVTLHFHFSEKARLHEPMSYCLHEPLDFVTVTAHFRVSFRFPVYFVWWLSHLTVGMKHGPSSLL